MTKDSKAVENLNVKHAEYLQLGDLISDEEVKVKSNSTLSELMKYKKDEIDQATAI